ncbi:uncharacterized protein TNCV_4846321 [Trichonephila clavipes]|uniref:Uncharacterized protein n=1 Tax=Trichonephila clavipes TaxID=2585209 RepID=A0A8X6WJV8_TRICX|nr:uncharacterized protein TNCV_4846321 [Trichonephila clavipes]
MRGKTARLDCSTVSLSSEELIAGEDDYVSTSSIISGKDILGNFAPLLWYVFASPQPFVGEKISSPNHSSVIFPISGPAATQPMAGLSLLS